MSERLAVTENADKDRARSVIAEALRPHVAPLSCEPIANAILDALTAERFILMDAISASARIRGYAGELSLEINAVKFDVERFSATALSHLATCADALREIQGAGK